MEQPPETGDLAPAELARRLAAACTRHFGSAVRVEGLFRHSGGASRQTWGFDATLEHAGSRQRHALVLRRDPPRSGAAGTLAGETSLALDRGVEFELLQVAPGNVGLIAGTPGDARTWGGTIKINF